MRTRLRISFQSVCFRALRSAVMTLLALGLALPAAAQEGAESSINASWEFARANRLAGAGAVTRSIPHYEKVLEAAPQKYPQAYFNLAEVYRFKKQCKRAVLLYNAYAGFEKGAESQADARNGIAQCTAGAETGTLTVAVSPASGSEVRVDGYLIRRGGLDEATLLPGDYTVEVAATDHVPQTHDVSISEGGGERVEVELEKKLFFGTLQVAVDQEGANIKIEPKELDSPRAKDATLTDDSPMEKPKELATGKYFLEITKPGYDRWIRNVYIKRDQESYVQVRMTEALPEAIRPK